MEGIRANQRVDMVGQRFGRLTVVRHHGFMKRRSTWVCQCDCGKETIVSRSALRNANTKSCGCLNHDSTVARNFHHGAASRKFKTAEYRSYTSAKGRCQNPNKPDYELYGGRGIEFRFNSFEEFFEHLGPKPSPSHSVDRINNNGHYEPGNVRWATALQQAANRRPSWPRGRKDQ